MPQSDELFLDAGLDVGIPIVDLELFVLVERLQIVLDRPQAALELLPEIEHRGSPRQDSERSERGDAAESPTARLGGDARGLRLPGLRPGARCHPPGCLQACRMGWTGRTG